MTWQGEWGLTSVVVGDPTKGTTFDYTDWTDPANPKTDLFGRVRKTTTADQQVTRTDYAGVSSWVTVEKIKGGTGATDFIDAQTLYDKDAFGRLTKVVSPRFPNTAIREGADAHYTYDRLDRLTTVRLETQNPSTGALSSQFRTFTYDALGRQLTATNPENGTTTNLAYDVLGNVLSRQDSAGSLYSYSYDPASRLLEGWLKRSGLDPNIRIITNTYDETGGVFGASLGKLTTSVSYDDDEVGVFKEQRRYNGLNGRLSAVASKVGQWVGDPNVALESQPEVVMGYAYDDLGQVSQLTYPTEPGVPARVVSKPVHSYLNGYLSTMSDPDPARGSLITSMSYNKAGGLWKLKTRGNVETTVTADVRNRPSTIAITGPNPENPGPGPGGTLTLFNSGTYKYDGAGNISQIGTDTFAYDRLNRLTVANMSNLGTLYTLTWAYDQLGNMTGYYKGTDSSGVTASASSWWTIKTAANGQSTNQIDEYGVIRSVGGNDDPYAVEYDSRGNLTSDRQFSHIFDARNRLVEVQRLDGSLVARYRYDQQGYRVSKYEASTGLTSFYFRGASGQTLSEFRRPTGVATVPTWSKDYVYAIGRHVAMIENEAPAPPGGLSSATNGAGQSPAFVDIFWAPNSDLDLLKYRIHRNDGVNPVVIFDQTNLSNTSWHDTTVTNGQKYTYRVTAVDLAGTESDYSEPVVITPGDNTVPGSPIPGLPGVGDRRVELEWAPPNPTTNDDVWGYRITRRELPSGSFAPLGACPSNRFHIDTGVRV